MASRSEKLNVDLTATDNLSGKVGSAADAVEGLDGKTASVDLEADDDASEDIEDVTEATDELDGESASVDLEAEDDATGDIEDVTESLDDLDGESATVDLEAEDDATEDVEDVAEAVEALDGESATVTIDATGAEEAESATGGITDNLGLLVGSKGLAALSAAGFVAIGAAAADSVVNVKGLAESTGSTLEEASRLNEVWDLIGGSTDTLERNIARANDTLRESPELARDLGIEINNNMSPMDVFIEAVTALNSGQLTAAERIRIAMELFGTRGLILLNNLQAETGDLREEMAAVGDEEIITDDDAAAALAFKQQMDAIGDKFAAIGRDLLPAVNAGLTAAGQILDSWPVDVLVNLLGTMTSGSEAVDQLNSELAELFDRPQGASFVEDLQEAWAKLKADLADNGVIDDTAEILAFFAEQSGKTEGEILELAAGTDEAADSADAATGKMDAFAEATEDSEGAARNLHDAIDGQVDALEDEKDALEESTDALKDKLGAQLSLTDSNFALSEAQRDLNDSVETFTAVAADDEASADDLAAAYDGVALSARDVAAAELRVARDTATANGATLSQRQELDITNRSFLNSAATIDGPLRNAILGYVFDLNQIPPTKASEIIAAVNAGDLNRANLLLADASRTRTTAVDVDLNDAQVANIEAIIQALTRARTVKVTASSKFGKFHTGGIVPGPRSQESLAVLQGGEAVFTADQQRALASMIGAPAAASTATAVSPATWNVTVNMPPGSDGEDVLRALQNLQRRRGPLPLRVA